MSAKGKHQEHDTFVRDFFSEPRWAIELLKIALPGRMLEVLDLEKLEVHRGTYFKKRRERRSDLLYRIPVKNIPGKYAYILLEHKSYPDKGVLVQIKEKSDAITEKLGINTLIVPLLFYQSENPWPYLERISNGWELPDNVRSVFEDSPAFGLKKLDLGSLDPETLNTSLTMRAVLYTLKYIRSADFKERLPRIAEMLQEAELAVIESLMQYIFDYRDESPEELEELVRSREEKIGRIVMTTTEQCIERGKELARREFKSTTEQCIERGKELARREFQSTTEQCMERGAEKARREFQSTAEQLQKKAKLDVARRMLDEGMEIKLVMKMTGLDLEQLKSARA